MADLDSLQERINALIADEKQKKEQERQQEQVKLEEIEQKIEELKPLGWHIFKDLIEPRLKVIADSIDDVLYHPPGYRPIGTLEFNRLREYEASVMMEVGLKANADFSEATAFYSFKILPIFMEYNSDNSITFPADAIDEDKIAAFLDDNIADGIKTYFQMKDIPQYRKDEMATDPVSGKTFKAVIAKGYAVFEGKKYYFSSIENRAEFLQDPKKFV